MLTEVHFFFCCPFRRQKIELPSMDNVQTVPPPYVVRTVLIYSRHAGQLQFNPSEAVNVSMTLFEISGLNLSKIVAFIVNLTISSVSCFLDGCIYFTFKALLVLVSYHRKCCSLHIFSLMWFTSTTGWTSRGMRPAGG